MNVIVVCRNNKCHYNKEELCYKPLALVISESGKCLNFKDKENGKGEI